MISGVYRGDGRAVTPVVGILLLLALTLILGLTIASFVVAMGEEPTDKPTAAFEFALEDVAGGSEIVQIGHSAGDNIQSQRL